MTVKTFISRPLLSLVISVFIVLLGVISLLSLPVERYPDIAPPAIYVWASYPGASAETVHKSVVMPLEEAINGVKIVTFDNTDDFLFASIREVILTLVIAIVLVLVVVLFFLQDFRATLIPAVGIIVSLIGTFAFMKVAGFSVNLLTLFALVLVIGTVLDDSIVVVEAVKAKLDEGFTTTRKASEDAMNGLSVTLFTTTLVFMVIFIPVAFMGGTTREENQTSGRVIFIFLICIVFAYLVMVALYESLFIPLSVMLSVPFGLAGSLLFAKLFGVENNIYMQIGMVMLVGLLSKTAILLTEYASQARREGMSLAEAALSSAKVRLRPILMTSLTMIIGMLPP